MKKRYVSILMFDDVEVLDFAGPFEVFSVSKDLEGDPLFDVSLVSVSNTSIIARNGLKVTADVTIKDFESADILIVPGGMGTRALVKHEAVISWIREVNERTEMMLSVCTGSLLLAKAGLLAGQSATTHHHAFDLLASIDPTIDIKQRERFVDNGRIVTSAGISAGIDMSFHVLEKLYGKAISDQTAKNMEYRRIGDD